MNFSGLTFVTFEGKASRGRPSNAFKAALEKAQKSFLGQFKITINVEKGVFALTLCRNGVSFLSTSKADNIELACSEDGIKIIIPDHLIHEQVSFIDVDALSGFQNGLKIVVNMHFVKCGGITSKENRMLEAAIQEVEAYVLQNQTNGIRHEAIKQSSCCKNMAAGNSDEVTEQLKNLEAKFTDLKTKSISGISRPQKPICKKYYCECKDCLLKKQEVKISLEKEMKRRMAEFEIRAQEAKKILAQQIHEDEHLKGEQKWKVEFARLQEEHDNKLTSQRIGFENSIQKVDKEKSKVESENRDLRQQISQQQRVIDQLREEIRQLIAHQQPPPPPPQSQPSPIVYVTRTGLKYHSRPGCPGLSQASAVFPRALDIAQTTLEPCSRCY